MNAQSSRVIPISDARRKADEFAAWQQRLDYDAWLHAREVQARLLAQEWQRAQKVSIRDAVIFGLIAGLPTAIFFCGWWGDEYKDQELDGRSESRHLQDEAG